MRDSQDRSRNDDRLLAGVWTTLAGLMVAAGAIYGGTLIVEAIMPTLPDQARAGTAVTPAASLPFSASLVESYKAVSVEHFHAQFGLRPGGVVETHVEAF